MRIPFNRPDSDSRVQSEIQEQAGALYGSHTHLLAQLSNNDKGQASCVAHNVNVRTHLGWQSFDSQFDPYPRAFTEAPSWCDRGCRSRTDDRIHRSQFLFYARERPTARYFSSCPISEPGCSEFVLNFAKLSKFWGVLNLSKNI